MCIYLVTSLFWGTILAETTTPTTTTTTTVAQNTLENTDITAVGMNMFSMAYKWEVGNYSGYQSDAFRGFSKKLNLNLRKSKGKDLQELLKKCDNCSNFVESSFDDALAQFFKETPPELTTWESAYFVVVNPHLHEKIRSAGLTAETRRAINNTIAGMVASITSQVTQQMDAFRDVSGMGLYYDGDTDNSPYDLLDDIRRIDEIFFREAPWFGDYKNTSKWDASALITGQVQQWSWIGGGKNYEIDLLSDVKEAMGDGSEEWTGSGNWEVAGDCDGGYCVTVDFIQSTHYFLSGTAQSPWSGSSAWGGSSSGWKNSFQGIFEEALEWITKNGDKRNFACKAATSIFAYETENDMNLSLSKIFSGLGIFVFWKTPKFLLWFLNRNDTSTKTSTSSEGSTAAGTSGTTSQTKEDKRTENALRDAFRARWLDYDRPTNLKWSAEKAFAYSGLLNATVGEQPAGNIAASVGRTRDLYNQILKENWAWSNRVLIHDANRDSIKHIEKTFDEILVRARLLRQFSEDLNKLLKYLKEKPDCGN